MTIQSFRRQPSSGDGGGARPNPWIIGSWHDALLFVGTPLLIVPLFVAARQRYSLNQIGAFVGAFGAMGHHLPGMLRAYGDWDLFRRFKTRFIVSPVFLLVTCSLLAHWDLRVLGAIILYWGFWHALMQVYGIARIYDAKVGSFAPVTAWLDFFMYVAWFGAGLLYSTVRLPDLLAVFYKSGGPLVPPAAIATFRDAWAVGTAIITVAFLANMIWRTRRGEAPNPIKLLLLVGSVGFWWYAMVTVNNAILGVALFEVFHDVQYLSIVWIFNRKVVDDGGGGNSFARFLFRRSGLMILLYVAAVFAYGSLGILWPNTTGKRLVTHTLFGALAASTLLHFYFDGFIWSVRGRSTRKGLGLAGGQADDPSAWSVPDKIVHGLKWALFVVPICVLAAWQGKGTVPELERYRNIVAAVPGDADSRTRLGTALQTAGMVDEAMTHYRFALSVDPDSADAHNNLGVALLTQGDRKEAIGHYRLALEIEPGWPKAHYNLGIALIAEGRLDEAIAHLTTAVRATPQDPAVHYDLGVALESNGRRGDAVQHYREAVRLDPDHLRAHTNLGVALASQGKLDEAIVHYRHAVRLGPNDARGRYNLGTALAMTGRRDEALESLRAAARLKPDWAAPRERIVRLLNAQPPPTDPQGD